MSSIQELKDGVGSNEAGAACYQNVHDHSDTSSWVAKFKQVEFWEMQQTSMPVNWWLDKLMSADWSKKNFLVVCAVGKLKWNSTKL